MTDQELIAIGKAAVAFVSLVIKTAKIEPSGEDYLTAKYGESCSRKEAAAIIGKTPASVTQYIRDGRLHTVPGSAKVDVRSVAQYLVNEKQADFEARQAKKGRKPGTYIVPSRRDAPWP